MGVDKLGKRYRYSCPSSCHEGRHVQQRYGTTHS